MEVATHRFCCASLIAQANRGTVLGGRPHKDMGPTRQGPWRPYWKLATKSPLLLNLLPPYFETSLFRMDCSLLTGNNLLHCSFSLSLHICMYVCICLYIYIYTYIYTYMYLYTYICISLYIHTHIYNIKITFYCLTRSFHLKNVASGTIWFVASGTVTNAVSTVTAEGAVGVWGPKFNSEDWASYQGAGGVILKNSQMRVYLIGF